MLIQSSVITHLDWKCSVCVCVPKTPKLVRTMFTGELEALKLSTTVVDAFGDISSILSRHYKIMWIVGLACIGNIAHMCSQCTYVHTCGFTVSFNHMGLTVSLE